jgi:hypothetical protein
VAGSDLVLIFGMDMAGSLLEKKLAGKIKSGERRANRNTSPRFKIGAPVEWSWRTSYQSGSLLSRRDPVVGLRIRNC